MRPEVYAAFVEHLGRLQERPVEKLAMRTIDPQSLSPAGIALLRQHAGEGPYDDLDMTEAVMSEEERTGRAIPDEAMGTYYREPTGYVNRPGLFNKLRRGIGAGGKKPIYGPPQTMEFEGDIPKLPKTSSVAKALLYGPWGVLRDAKPGLAGKATAGALYGAPLGALAGGLADEENRLRGVLLGGAAGAAGGAVALPALNEALLIGTNAGRAVTKPQAHSSIEEGADLLWDLAHPALGIGAGGLAGGLAGSSHSNGANDTPVKEAEANGHSATPPWLKALTLAGLVTGTGVGMLRARELPGAAQKAKTVATDLGIGTTLGWSPTVAYEGVHGLREMGR